jgi:hypothetical protein
MKKILIVTILLVAIAAVWEKSESHLHESAPAQTAAAKPEPLSAPVVRKSVKNDPIPRSDLTLKPQGESIPKECGELWQNLATISLQQLSEDLKRGVYRINAECEKYESQDDLVSKVYKACAYDVDHGNLIDERSCLSSAVLYRAQWIDRMTSGQTDYKTMTLAMLSNKIIGRFGEMIKHPEQKTELLKMINALIEREPQMVNAYKAWIATEIPEIEKPNYPVHEMRTMVQKALALNPKDAQLTEAYLFNEDRNGFPHRVDEFVQENPDSSYGYYYRAWNSWKNENREAALADLKKAVRLNPADTRMTRTLEDIEQGGKSEPFLFTMGFNFGDL